MNYKVSVLVAAYNAEKYISECLDSLLRQTLKEIQVICIDDASTDRTLDILKKYAARDARIVVLSQPENAGQACARNRGLSVAEGEFITMLDSDDWLSDDALEQAYRVTEKNPRTDAVLFDLMYYYQSDDRYVPYHYRAEKRVYSGEEALALSLDWQIHGLYLIRHSIHQAYPYDTTSRMYSDDNTTRLHFFHSREIRFCEGIYYYRQHAESRTHVCNIRRFDFMDAGLSLKRSLLAENVSMEIIARQENFRWIIMVESYLYYLQYKHCFSTGERKEILARFRFHLQQLDVSLLKPGLKYKFGYIPFRGCFPLFQVEVAFYDLLRRTYYKLSSKRKSDNLPGK